MAEVTHFYDESTSVITSTTSAWTDTPVSIAGTSLTANKKYIIVAKATLGNDSASAYAEFRVQTADDVSVEEDSVMIIEPTYINSDELCGYFWCRPFWTDATPADVKLQYQETGAGQGHWDQMSLLVFDPEPLGFCESSGNGISPATTYQAVYGGTGTQEAVAQAFTPQGVGDLSAVSLYMYSTGSVTDNCYVLITQGSNPGGTTLATSGDVNVIGQDWWTFTFSPISLSKGTKYWIELYRDGARDTSNYYVWEEQHASETNAYPLALGGGGYRSSGSWTDQGADDPNLFIAASDGGYREIWNTGLGGDPCEYATTWSNEAVRTADTAFEDILPTIAPGALDGDTEYLAIGSQRTHIGSTGSQFEIRLVGDSDAGNVLDQLTFHSAEGEDTNEIRNVAVMGRILTASSPTVGVQIEAQEEAANANAKNGGGCLILLPTALFADFDYSFAATGVTVSGTPASPTTLETISAYNPTTSGNHLVLGRYNYTVAGADSRVSGQLTVGGTSVLSGDIDTYQTQNWDPTDGESVVLMGRESISSSGDIDLDGATHASDTDATSEYEFVCVLNLNLAGGPSLVAPRRQLTTVRM